MTYNGEEIGMTDTYVSWERTVDPVGCLAGKAEYEVKSRDPSRTPFQWNNSVAAGKFTTSTPMMRGSNDHFWVSSLY